MSGNRGKQFEDKLKEDFIRTVGPCIDRIYDTTNGFYGISNISDFIAYDYPLHFYLECKARKGASISFNEITQYDKLLGKVGLKGVRAGVVLWLQEKDKVLYIPISTIKQLKDEGEKSVGLRHLDKYNIIDIPSTKKRVFMDSDYSVLKNLPEGC